MTRRALVTGVSGQDGSYLTELLLAKGYEVHGLVRAGRPTRPRLAHLTSAALHLHEGDITDADSLERLVRTVRPHEVYNLAAQSHVGDSFRMPVYTDAVVGRGPVRLLGAIRDAGVECRYYQASTSEMFGDGSAPPQHERSPFRPTSPYGASKLYAHLATAYFRRACDLYAVCGISFNHESPRRGEDFVTRKITRAAAAIKLGLADTVSLGNLDASRDWGYAPEYVEAMWLMLQRDEPDDFVLATGQARSVRDFCALAFGHVGLDWRDHVVHDSAFERPRENNTLVGDPTRAREVLGWKAETTVDRLAALMVDADLALLSCSSEWTI